MDVTSTSPTTQSTTSQTSSSAKGSSDSVAANALTGDFNTFIQLLTAQMNNQDPLEPTSNTEFVAQLASFSAVEQQILTNETLSTMVKQMGLDQASGIGTWIGKEVLVQGGLANFTGEPIEAEVTPVATSDHAVLVVRNESGVIVAQKSSNNEADRVTWDGTDNKGNPLAAGLYSFQLESSLDGKVISTQSAKVFSEITEVRLTEDGTQLVTAGGNTVNTDEVTAIR